MKLTGLIAFIALLSILYAQVYALWDVLARQPDLSIVSRVLWFVGMLFFPILITIAYLRTGPGIAHWPPWDSAQDD